MELTIPYEKNENTLKRREAEKEEKYLPLKYKNIKTQLPEQITKTKVMGIVAIGSTGTINSKTVDKLKVLGIASHAQNLGMLACLRSVYIWKQHCSLGT